MASEQTEFYYQFEKEINSDQLNIELQQAFIEQPVTPAFLYITTVPGIVTLAFDGELTEDELTYVTGLVDAHVPAPPTEVALSEYEDNDDAKENGLTNGNFYRTGDFLKIVHD